jgi:hypothetical protein
MRGIDLDDDARRAFAFRRPCAVAHGLVDHSLLTIDALAELADELPRTSIEMHEPDLGSVVPGGAPPLPRSPSTAIVNIAEDPCWIGLWNIERVGRYGDLIDDCLDSAAEAVGYRPTAFSRRVGFAFISAQNSVTPVHFDSEQNFLLQIAGVKHVNTGVFPDRNAEQREVDRFYDGGSANLDKMPEIASSYELRPGTGVYLPPLAPHWVQNGSEVSVSLSVTFWTASDLRSEKVNRFNALARRFRHTPLAPGRSVVVDASKVALMASGQTAKNLARRARTRDAIRP